MFPSASCGGFGPVGWLLMIGLWGSLLAVAVWAVTRLFPSGKRTAGPADADGDAPQRHADVGLGREVTNVPSQEALLPLPPPGMGADSWTQARTGRPGPMEVGDR